MKQVEAVVAGTGVIPAYGRSLLTEEQLPAAYRPSSLEVRLRGDLQRHVDYVVESVASNAVERSPSVSEVERFICLGCDIAEDGTFQLDPLRSLVSTIHVKRDHPDAVATGQVERADRR